MDPTVNFLVQAQRSFCKSALRLLGMCLPVASACVDDEVNTIPTSSDASITTIFESSVTETEDSRSTSSTADGQSVLIPMPLKLCSFDAEDFSSERAFRFKFELEIASGQWSLDSSSPAVGPQFRLSSMQGNELAVMPQRMLAEIVPANPPLAGESMRQVFAHSIGSDSIELQILQALSSIFQSGTDFVIAEPFPSEKDSVYTSVVVTGSANLEVFKGIRNDKVQAYFGSCDLEHVSNDEFQFETDSGDKFVLTVRSVFDPGYQQVSAEFSRLIKATGKFNDQKFEVSSWQDLDANLKRLTEELLPPEFAVRFSQSIEGSCGILLSPNLLSDNGVNYRAFALNCGNLAIGRELTLVSATYPVRYKGGTSFTP